MRHVDGLSDLPLTIVGHRPMSENKTGDWRSQRPVIDESKCTGCLICWKFCPEACVDIKDRMPAISMDFCKGCAVCAAECPQGCIEMKEEAAW